MSLIEVIKSSENTLSFEVFPPKNDTNFDLVKSATEEIARLNPSFISITYGAGGGTSRYTLDMCKNIEYLFSVPTVAHLTCISSNKHVIHKQLIAIKEAGIKNIMALRGDLTPEIIKNKNLNRDYNYAYDLIREIRSFSKELCIGGACYPEVHPESKNITTDLTHLKEKVDAGCSFLTTQMFFDNKIFYEFLDKVRNYDINVPILPGIMPVTSINQLERINVLSRAYIPKELLDIIDKYGHNQEDMKKAGIDYAIKQILDIYSKGIKHIHVYSMNKPDVAFEIKNRVLK